MKYLYLALFLITTATPALAENRYVIDELRVPLRSSPCSRCSIIDGGIKSGTKLTFIKEQKPDGENEAWSQVTTGSGKTGWMPSQYLTSQQVAKIRIKQVEAELDSLKQANQQLETDLASANEQQASLQNQITELTLTSNSVNEELSEIKQLSGSAISLQNQNQELLKRNKMLQGEIDILTASNEQLLAKDSQTWFFYGGLTAVMGALLAVILPRLKRRKKFSEWG